MYENPIAARDASRAVCNLAPNTSENSLATLRSCQGVLGKCLGPNANGAGRVPRRDGRGCITCPEFFRHKGQQRDVDLCSAHQHPDFGKWRFRPAAVYHILSSFWGRVIDPFVRTARAHTV